MADLGQRAASKISWAAGTIEQQQTDTSYPDWPVGHSCEGSLRRAVRAMSDQQDHDAMICMIPDSGFHVDPCGVRHTKRIDQPFDDTMAGWSSRP